MLCLLWSSAKQSGHTPAVLEEHVLRPHQLESVGIIPVKYCISCKIKTIFAFLHQVENLRCILTFGALQVPSSAENCPVGMQK